MSDGLNKVLLFGNLGADPELRVTPSGQSVLNLRLATTESYLDKSNTRQERTEWHSVTIWGKRAEALAKFLSKGDKVFIEGSIRTSKYQKNGEDRYRTEINATNIILGGGRGRGGDRGERPIDETPARDYGRGPAPAASTTGGGDDFGYPGVSDDDVPFAFIGAAPFRAPRWERW